MYLPRHFAQEDPAALHALMRAHPLAMLVSIGADGLTADHVPLSFDPSTSRLQGHVARANPLWRHADGQPVMAVFRGPEAYVSPSWYPSKAVHHKVVPTWNYAVVHAHGRLQAVDNAPWLHTLVSQLTAEHESSRDRPWGVDDAPPDYIQQMLGAIVGIEIGVERLIGKWKLSQNRSAEDRDGVRRGLAEQTGPAPIAAWMEGTPATD